MQWGWPLVRHDATYGTHVASLVRTGQRLERGQLRFSSPSALAMHDDVGHLPVVVISQLPWQSAGLDDVQRPVWPAGGVLRAFCCCY